LRGDGFPLPLDHDRQVQYSVGLERLVPSVGAEREVQEDEHRGKDSENAEEEDRAFVDRESLHRWSSSRTMVLYRIRVSGATALPWARIQPTTPSTTAIN